MLTTARAAGLAAWLAVLLLGTALILGADAAAQSPTPTPTTVDYDTDDDGLIEIKTLGQLFAIRQDLNGDGAPDPMSDSTNYNGAFPDRVTTASGRNGCPTSGGCTGYELDNDLNFDENRDGRITSADSAFWNSGAGWEPIGRGGSGPGGYNATFEGNGHTISYLYINRSEDYQALFGDLTAGKEIRNVGVKHATVVQTQTTARRFYHAILVGRNNGTITKSYVTGSVLGGLGLAGGLTGRNTGTIRASYSLAAVSTRLGENVPQPGGGFVRTQTCVDTAIDTRECGGLAGSNDSGATIIASWSAGKVETGNPAQHATTANGLAGGAGTGGSGATTNSYWDTQTSGRSNSTHGTGQTTRALQRPTGYTGIYANWNLNLDGNAGGDDPWDFGTNREYPALKYDGQGAADLEDQRGPSRIEADHWGAPVVGEPVVAYYYDGDISDRSDPMGGAPWETTCDGRGAYIKRPWVWQRSDNGRTGWTTVTSTGLTASGSCSFIYVPATADVGKYLRACVPRWLYGNGCTFHTAPVVASSAATATTATFASGNTSPVVGTDVVISALPRPRTDRTVWRWQRCTANDGTGCTVLAPVDGRSSWTYRPVAADVGNYLRAFVYYSDNSGTWTRAVTGFTGAVAAGS